MGDKKRVLVLGMARSGYEAAMFLASKGYEVIVNDRNVAQNTDQINELYEQGVQVILGDHPEDLVDDSFEMIIKNPGIKNDHKYVIRAKELNIPVINEIELAFRYFPTGVTIVGITGTNGKTTTTMLIYEILKQVFKGVFIAGNIGYPLCSIVSQLKEGDIVVMEISDHQLCNIIDFKTNISVMTNISEAHLDFHGSYDIYKGIKRRIFNRHTESDIAVLNYGDPEVVELSKSIQSMKKCFSFDASIGTDCSVVEGYICYKGEKIIRYEELKMKGKHNCENAMGAIMVAKEFGVDNKIIIDVLKTFAGVEHRLEYVRTVNGVDFYNDSKSTNIESTKSALACFKKPIILLMGGLDRGHSFEELKGYMNGVALILAFGEARNRIGDFACECGIPCVISETLDVAIQKAYDAAFKGCVILLSPACAAWDQFSDFEARGNMYKHYINEIRVNE